MFGYIAATAMFITALSQVAMRNDSLYHTNLVNHGLDLTNHTNHIHHIDGRRQLGNIMKATLVG